MNLTDKHARGTYQGENPDFDPKQPSNFSNSKRCMVKVEGPVVATSFNDSGDLFVFIQDTYGHVRRCASETVVMFFPGITIVETEGA